MILRGLEKKQQDLTLSFIVEGTTEKVSHFIMPLKSIYNRNFCFNQQKYIFEHFGKVKTTKIYLKLHFYCHKNVSVNLFGAANHRGYVHFT